MAEATMGKTGGTAPAAAPPVVRAWWRVSPRLVPLLAVLTALIITVPFMIVTGGRGDVGRGLNIAGTAYAALIEGSTGLAVNDILTRDNLNLVIALAESGDGLTSAELRRLSSEVSAVTEADTLEVRAFGEVLARIPLDDEQLNELGSRVPAIAGIGADRLDSMRPIIADLTLLDRGEVRALAEDFAALEGVTPEDRAAVEVLAPSAANLSDEELLDYLTVVDEQGIVALERVIAQVDVLNDLGLDANHPDVQAIAAMAALEGGVEEARTLASTVSRLDAAGLTDTDRLAEQLTLTRELYSQDLLTEDDVATAIETELDTALASNLLVRRPGNRLVIDRTAEPAGMIWSDNNTPDDPTDDRPETVYLRLGGSALLFFPSNLETMIVRSIPFIIAGLAVALGFKAGLFNIGAEGQLYLGGVLAVWVGFSPIFAGLPLVIHLPLVLLVGITGGGLWGAIPGALKAYTGAHEVIVTIMLNYVAVLLVDWLIKSTDPLILLDPAASTPRTPFIGTSAQLPSFDQLSVLVYIAAGIVVLAWGLWSRRERIQQDARYAIRPVVYGVLVTLGGLFLAWTAVRGNLHLGFLLMLAAVWFTDWFLNRTTLGFELRTVGANPDAAKYAGMNVKRNIIFAMVVSGGLAGLAGVVEISGVQFNMQPAFFAGLGFDAIAVALLARSNPRGMIPAGLLWGSLLTGAGLMQVRAEISIDLVKIIQALIIMFIAADTIIRYLWRVPKTSERAATTFSKGWGG